MRFATFSLLLIFQVALYAQHDNCSLPKTWYPDRSKLNVSFLKTDESGPSLNLEQNTEQIILPDSVTFSEKKRMDVWYDGSSLTGTFKATKSKVKWTLRDVNGKTSLVSVRKESLSKCDLIENGIAFFSNRKQPSEQPTRWLSISYLLKPNDIPE